MKIKKIVFILIATLLSTLINAQTSYVTEGCAPLVVNYTAPSGYTTWFWDFKDGATSDLENPANTFINAGIYVVEFREAPASPIVGTVTITVHAKLTPQLTANSPIKGCVPLDVNISANTIFPPGVSLNTYKWTFGDGAGGTDTSVNHIYNVGGVYNVSVELKTSSPSCDNTKIFSNFISCSTPPSTMFSTSPNPPASCNIPLTVSFINNSTSTFPLKYDWKMGNGNTFTSLMPPIQTYSITGTYTVVLTATDTNNCSATFQKNVSVGKPFSKFIIPDTVCLNAPITTIKNLSTAGTSAWNIGFNAAFLDTFTSASLEPHLLFTSSGLQSVKLTTTSTGCSDDTTMFVYVEKSAVSFTNLPVYSCYEPLTVKYNATSPNRVTKWDWSFGSDLQNPTFTYDLPMDSADVQPGLVKFLTSLHITTASGCVDSFASSVLIQLPWARFLAKNTKGCAPLTVTFTDSSKSKETITNWIWNYGDGTPVNSLTGKTPHTHIFTSPGIYDVVLVIVNNLGCKDTAYKVRVEVGEPKTIDFSADKAIVCPGEAVKFTNLTINTSGINGWHYSSDKELLSNCSMDNESSLIFKNTTGPQTVTLTAEYNGCYSSVSKTNLINVKGPVADFNYSISCGTANVIELTDSSKDATALTWDFGDGNTSPANGKFTHTYATTGDYNIILKAINAGSGCPESKDSITAHIRNVKAVFETDTLLCQGVPYNYDANSSVDATPTGFKGYTWIFSDSTQRPITSNSPSSDISFPTRGLQTIGLVVEDFNGCRDTLIKKVKVYGATPNYSISDQSICMPDTILFKDLSLSDTTITNWLWNFGDGASDTTMFGAQHIYTTSPLEGLRTSLYTTDALGCKDTLKRIINVYIAKSIISSLPNICLGQPVTLSASDFTSEGSHLTFDWDLGDGNFARGNNSKYIYGSSGTKTVTLLYKEVATGCAGTTDSTFAIQDYPVASYTTDVDTLLALCNPQQVNFTNTSTSTSPITTFWNWSLGKQHFVDQLSVTFPKGNYPVKLIVSTSFGCNDTMTKMMHIIGPEGNFSMSKNNICKGDEIVFTVTDTLDVGTYAFDFGDGTSASDTGTIGHIYNFLPPSGQTVAKFTMYCEGGVCPVAVNKDVYIYYVKANFTRNSFDLDTVICLGENLLLTNTSSPSNGNIFSWTLGDQSTSSSPSSFNYKYAQTGIYAISLAAQNSNWGCQDTISKLVKVVKIPEVKAIGDTVCKFALTQLSVENYNPLNHYAYSWTPANALNNPAIYNPTLTAISTDKFKVEVLDSNSCSNSDTAYLFVIQPLISVTFDTAIVAGDSINLPIYHDDGIVKFTWTPEVGLTCLNCTNPGVAPKPIIDKLYSLYAEDILGCTNATSNFNVYIRPETFIKLPTTFTPNGDGVNDIIYVEGWGIKDLLSFQIYNRWGELIFETSELSEGWTGYYKGVLQNNDVYVYKVKAISQFQKELQKEGHINLMR